MDQIIETKKQLDEFLELEVVNKGIKANFLRIIEFGERNILDKHQIFLRKTEYYFNTGQKIFAAIYKIRLLNMQNKYSLHIPINCCGKGLRILHLGPILINQKAKIGENCIFHFNNAVVAKGTGSGVPIIGNNVVFGIGAIATGDIEVADNVAIGANAVVCKDVMEENIAIAGAPAKKISNHGSKYW